MVNKSETHIKLTQTTPELKEGCMSGYVIILMNARIRIAANDAAQWRAANNAAK